MPPIRNNRRKTSRRPYPSRPQMMQNRVMHLGGSSFRGFVFPERLRANFRIAYNTFHSYSAGPNQYTTVNLSNAIAVLPGNYVSGLYWLISGLNTTGNSYAPYTLGVTRKAKVEVYGKVAANATGNASALMVTYPLAYGTTSTGLTLSNAEEQFGRSNIVEFPLAYDSVPNRRPLSTKIYNVWDLIGISESTYMNSLDEHSFNYFGMLSTATSQCVAIQTGVESGATDATLTIRLNIIVELEIEFYARNGAVVTAPHA